MGVKQKTRPAIRIHKHAALRDEHLKCATPSCRNIVARWINKRHCSRCRKRTDTQS